MSAESRGGSARNSRRRRWEVKSRESFESTLAIEYESPGVHKENKNSANKNEKRKKSGKSGRAKSASSVSTMKDDEDDPLSARISALIEEASVKSRDSPTSTPTQEKGPAEDNVAKEPDPPQTSTNPFDDEPDYPPEFNPFGDDDSPTPYDEPLPVVPKQSKGMLGCAFDTPVKPKYSESSGYNPSAPPLSPPDVGSARKSRRKKRSEPQLMLVSSKNEESLISVQLQDLKDDIIEMDKSNEPVIALPSLLLAHTSKQPTISTIFQEQPNGFVVARDEDEARQRLSESLHDVTQAVSRGSHAVFLQSGFRSFCVLCQGLLAGIAMAHCFLIFLFGVEPASFPDVYTSRMAHVFFAIIFFLTVICFVGACDSTHTPPSRCEVGGSSMISGHGIKVPWTPGFYLASLVLTAVAVRAEDVLTHHALYGQKFTQDRVSELVDWWRWMVVARGSLVVVAWLAAVPDPHTDALLDTLAHTPAK